MNHDNSNSANPIGQLEKAVDLIEIAWGLTSSTVVVVGGQRIEDLRIVVFARDHGIVDRIILVGSKERITQSIAEVGIEINRMIPCRLITTSRSQCNGGDHKERKYPKPLGQFMNCPNYNVNSIRR